MPYFRNIVAGLFSNPFLDLGGFAWYFRWVPNQSFRRTSAGRIAP